MNEITAVWERLGDTLVAAMEDKDFSVDEIAEVRTQLAESQVTFDTQYRQLRFLENLMSRLLS